MFGRSLPKVFEGTWAHCQLCRLACRAPESIWGSGSMLRTYSYRLFTTSAQEAALDRILGQARDVYNSALGQRREAWEAERRVVSRRQQAQYFVERRRLDPLAFGLLNQVTVERVLKRVEIAFGAYRRRLDRGHDVGFPRFKGRNRFRSLDFRHGVACELRVRGDRARLHLAGVGGLKVRLHRPLPQGAVVALVQVRRVLDKWHANLTISLPVVKPKAARSGAVGIDVGLNSLLAFSDGTLVDNPRWLKQSLEEMRRSQRRLSRRRLGSGGWRRAAHRVAVLHRKVRNQRRDFWHKRSRELVDQFGLVAIEELPLSFMTRHRRFARSAHDAGLGTFRQLLKQKAASAAVRVVAVDPRGTSQVCSACGATAWKELGERIHRCRCGLVLDRDVNAARNILRRAVGSGVSLEALTWPDSASVASEADQH
jgi:putative transposase